MPVMAPHWAQIQESQELNLGLHVGCRNPVTMNHPMLPLQSSHLQKAGVRVWLSNSGTLIWDVRYNYLNLALKVKFQGQRCGLAGDDTACSAGIP